MDDDSYADDDDSFTVTQIAATGGENSSVAGSSTYNNNFTSVTGNYGTLKVGADGTYTYVADQSAADDLDASDPATDSFTYTISDGTTTDTATLIFTVTGVNDVPTAADKTVTTNEDTPYVFSASDFGYTDADDDDALVSIKITTLENAGALQYYNGSACVDVTLNQVITATYIGNDKLRLNPTANENGSPYTTFNFTVNDGDADSASANTITVNVTAVNDAPTAANNTVTTNEDTDHTFAASEFNFTDVDGDSLDHISIETLPSNGTLLLSGNAVSAGDQISITNIANLVFRPATNENGTGYDTFTFSVNDGTVDGASTYTMTVNVTAVNDAPVADDETGAVNEDATLTVTDGTSDVLHGDTDVDSGDTLTVSAIRTGTEGGSGTAGSIGSGLTGTYGTLTLAADGTYTYAADKSAADDLDASDTATDIFTYTLSDGTATDTGTITITVTGVNDAPVAVNDTDAVNEDATVTRTSGSSLLMDDDSDADDDDSFTVTQIAVTGGSNSSVSSSTTYSNGTSITGTYGTLVVGANGSYTYVADQSAADDLDASDPATESFTYTISDGTTTDTATLIFTVTGVNDVPTAADKTVTTNEDTPYVF